MAWALGTRWSERDSPKYKIDWPPGVEPAMLSRANWHRGEKFQPEGLPLRLTLMTSHSELPDFSFMWSCARCVSEKFRDLVESREPGVHQFFSLPVVGTNGTPTSKTYFILNTCHRVEMTTAEVFVSAVGMNAKLDVFRRSEVAGMHIWLSRVPSAINDSIFVSDDLKGALTQAKFAGLEFSSYRIVDD
jgi:hypothetical protein